MAKKRTPVTYSVKNGLNEIRLANGELFAKVGTAKQVKAVIASIMQVKPEEINLNDFKEEEIMEIGAVQQDGPFFENNKWYIRVEGKAIKTKSYSSEEEAEKAYVAFE